MVRVKPLVSTETRRLQLWCELLLIRQRDMITLMWVCPLRLFSFTNTHKHLSASQAALTVSANSAFIYPPVFIWSVLTVHKINMFSKQDSWALSKSAAVCLTSKNHSPFSQKITEVWKAAIVPPEGRTHVLIIHHSSLGVVTFICFLLSAFLL